VKQEILESIQFRMLLEEVYKRAANWSGSHKVDYALVMFPDGEMKIMKFSLDWVIDPQVEYVELARKSSFDPKDLLDEDEGSEDDLDEVIDQCAYEWALDQIRGLEE
jgi:hypothetical protein